MAYQSLKLSNKVALITGAGNGIGAATAKLFTQYGATISLIDLDEKSLKATAAECDKINVGQPKVNNASVAKSSSLNSPLQDYEATFDINVKAVIHMTQLATPHLIKTKGSIINIASITAHRVFDGRMYYGMSKAAVKHFTQYAAHELGQHHVRVNSISPGTVKTNICLNFGIAKDELDQYLEACSKKHALQRCAEPSEIADLIAYLASDESTFITGTDILLDGGCALMPPVSANVDAK